MNTHFIRAVLFLVAASAFALPSVVESPTDDPFSRTLTFDSPALAKGSAPGSGQGELVVQLPPSYFSSPNRRFPVVYTLHGYGDNVDQLIGAVEPLLEGFDGPEFILVGVAGGTSFYTDSPVHGNAAQMVVEEAVPLIDSHFRTLPKAEARVLAGFSMGGYGAWTLGLARPDLFAALWVCCPGAFDQTGLREALGQWRSGMFYDYAATFAPGAEADGRWPLPLFDGTASDNAYVSALESGFGGGAARLAAYQAETTRLKAVRFDYGINDYFPWIARGTEALASQFQSTGIPTTLVGWPAGHEITDDMVVEGLLPLLREVFSNL